MKDEKTIMKERCDFCGSGFCRYVLGKCSVWLLLPDIRDMAGIPAGVRFFRRPDRYPGRYAGNDIFFGIKRGLYGRAPVRDAV